MAPKRTDWRELALVASLLVFVAGLCLQPMGESDLFFHLKVGSEILAQRGLLGTNLFSFTAPDHPDLDLSWGFEVAAATLFRWGGFRAVVVAKTVWMMATFAALFAVCRRRGAGPLATTFVLACAAVVMRDRFVERPHIVSFAGEVLVLGTCCALAPRSVRGPRSTSHPPPPPSAAPLETCCALPPRSTARFLSTGWAVGLGVGAVAWANMHAGLFAGVVMLLGAAAGWGWPGPHRNGRVALIAVALAGALGAAAILTPVGPLGLVRYLRLHLLLPRLHAVDEFRAATWRSDAPFFVWLAALAVVLVAWRALRSSPSRPRFDVRAREAAESDPRLQTRGTGPGLSPRPADLFPVLVMVALGLLSVRFAADAALVSAPLLACGVTALGRALPNTGFNTTAFAARLGATVIMLALWGATLWPRVTDAAAGRSCCDIDVDTAALPLEALRFVEANGLRERMYNDFEIGSYLLFQGYPRYRVFVDPRLPAYPADMHTLLGTFDLDRAAWGAAMDRYGVDSALLAYAGLNRRVAWWDPEEWALVFKAADSRVFVRRREPWRALIAAHEIPATFDFTIEQGTVTRPLDKKPARAAVADCEWERRLGDLVFELDEGRVGRATAHFESALQVPGCLAPQQEAALAAWMGALEINDRQHALAHLDRALSLSPDDTRTRANRGVVLEGLGRRAEAASDWQAVAAAAPGTPVGAAAAARARQNAR